MISRSATYAIRALASMATGHGTGWLLNRDIAAEVALPPQFLTKILCVLAAEGILLSQRGRSGGFRLARPANRITLLEIIDPFDRLSDRRTCLLGQTICSDERACPLHRQWTRLSDSLLRTLRNRTLAQLTRSPDLKGYPRGGGVRR